MKHINPWFEGGPHQTSIPKEADTVIIGGGFFGLVALCNVVVNAPNERIILIEDGDSLEGDSGRCIGEVCPQYDNPISDDHYKYMLAAANSIAALVGKNGTGSYRIFSSKEEQEKFLERVGELGVPLNKTEVKSIIPDQEAQCGVFMPKDLTVIPITLIRIITELANLKGDIFFSKGKVSEIYQDDKSACTKIAGEAIVKSNRVIIANEKTVGDLCPKVKPHISFVKKQIFFFNKLTSKEKRIFESCPFIMNEGKFKTAYHPSVGLFIEPSEIKFSDLEKQLDLPLYNKGKDSLKRFKFLKSTPVQTWSRVYCDTTDHFPIVDQVYDKIYVCVGSCGDTIVNAFIAGQVLGEMLFKKKDTIFPLERFKK